MNAGQMLKRDHQSVFNKDGYLDIEKIKSIIPPDKKLLENYRRATKFGHSTSEFPKCPLTNLPINNQEFSVWSNEQDFGENGHGYNLVFKDLKFAIIWSAGILLPISLILIYIYLKGSVCYEQNRADVHHELFDNATLSNSLSSSISDSFSGALSSFDITNFEALDSDLAKNIIENANSFVGRITPADMNPVATIKNINDMFFNPYGQGVSEVSLVFEAFLEFFSGHYIRDLVRYECRDQLRRPSKQREIPPSYREFCQNYYKMSCHIHENTPSCMLMAESFFTNKTRKRFCDATYYNFFSFGNILLQKDEEKVGIQKHMPIIYHLLFFVSMIIIIAYEVWHYRYVIVRDEKKREVNDTAVMLSGIKYPEGTTAKQVREALEKLLTEHGLTPKQISIVYNAEELLQEKAALNSLRTNEERYLFLADKHDSGYFDHNLVGEIRGDIKKLDREIKGQEVQYAMGNAENMTGSVFVCLKDEAEMREFMNKHKFKLRSLVINWVLSLFSDKDRGLVLNINGKKSRLFVFNAPHPPEILWQNLHVGLTNKYLRRILISFMAGCLVLFSFFINYKLKTNSVSSTQKEFLELLRDFREFFKDI